MTCLDFLKLGKIIKSVQGDEILKKNKNYNFHNLFN